MSRIVPVLAVSILAAACSEPEATPPKQGELVCVGCEEGFSLELPAAATGGESEARVTLVNAGDAALRLKPTSEVGPFLATCAAGCGELAPGAQAELRIAFRPREAGDAAAKLDLDAALLDVRAEAVAPEVACEPDPISFGKVVVTDTALRTAICTNLGSLATTIVPRRLGTSFDVVDHPVELPAGSSIELSVAYAPVSPGEIHGSLQILAGAELVETVELEAMGLVGAVSIPPPSQEEDCYDVGTAAPGTSAELAIPFWNESDVPVEVENLAIVDSTEFSVVSGPGVILPGAVGHAVVRFSPTEPGVRQGGLLGATSAPGAQPAVCVRGLGGGPKLQCETSSLDFGTVATSTPETMSLRCTNEGWRHADVDSTLVIGNLEVEPPFAAVLREPASRDIALGESFLIDVTLAPETEGIAEGALTIRSNDGGAGTATISLTGRTRDLPACEFEISASTLDFRNVDGVPVTLDVGVRNLGAEPCLIGASISGSARFRIDAPVPEELLPWEPLQIPVRFDPTVDVGSYEAELAIELNATPALHRIALRGASEERCQPVVPVDFGTIEAPGCASQTRTARLWTTCGEEALESIELLDPNGPFRIVRAPALPASGESVEVELAALADGTAMGVSYHSGLLLRYSGGRELLLPLSATASLEHQVDRFGGNPVDVLVLSGWGVGWLTPGEGAGFLDIARDHGLDFQYATTGTALRDDEVHCSGGPVEQGRLAPEEGGSRRIVRSSSPLEEQLAAMEAQTEGLVFCPSHPAGLEMARRALSAPLIDRTDDLRTGVPGDGNLGFMRPDADLEVVFLVTDYYDESPMPADWYIDFLRSRKSEGRRARFHAIGVATEATDMPYAQVATATRGLVTPTGPSRPAVEEISKEIFRVERCLPLSDVPAEETIEVRKDGVVVQRQTPSGDAWTYDATANEICFREASRPEPGEGVEIRYQRPCLLP